jgi:glycine dehydrogenase subunit 1
MGPFVPHSPADQAEMLQFLGLDSIDELYCELPDEVRLKRELNIPEGKSELEARRQMEALAAKNKVFPTIFRGAGAYRHYIPAIVREVASRETFVTAYTPYQPEVSQGVLQCIFEYQTMICELTGMGAANASVYDGATACAEAVAMCADKKRGTAYISGTMHPDYLRTVQTYCYAAGRKLVVIPEKDGVTDLGFLREHMGDDSACFLMQQPNFYGIIEDADAIVAAVKNAGAKTVMCVNPIYAAIGKTPGEYGADIAVGEGQPLGIALNFGGPYLGFMAASHGLVRKLPGRIVGQTQDIDGKRAFVMTLMAREQHIRREKASSNICSNQALNAVAAACYMAAMGPDGLTRAAEQCMSKAHYMAKSIAAIPGYELAVRGEFFHEFLTKCPVNPDRVMAKLEEKGILGGYSLTGKYEGCILWCCTELNAKAEIDALVEILKEGV